MADAHRRAGNIPAAVEAGQRAAEALAAMGDGDGEGFAWMVVAAAHVTGGAHADAVEATLRGLDRAEAAADASTIAMAALLRGRVAAERGELRSAALLLGYARAGWERLGSSRWEIEREYWEPIERALSASLPEEDRTRLIAEGASLSMSLVASLIREPLGEAR